MSWRSQRSKPTARASPQAHLDMTAAAKSKRDDSAPASSAYYLDVSPVDAVWGYFVGNQFVFVTDSPAEEADKDRFKWRVAVNHDTYNATRDPTVGNNIQLGSDVGRCAPLQEHIVAAVEDYARINLSFNGTGIEAKFLNDPNDNKFAALDLMDMIEETRADLLADRQGEAMTYQRELQQSSWQAWAGFWAAGYSALSNVTLRYTLPVAQDKRVESSIPSRVNGKENGEFVQHVRGEDPAASWVMPPYKQTKELSSLQDFKEARVLQEWTDGRADMIGTHLAITGNDTRIYDIPANTTFISAKGPRWYSRTTNNQCYFTIHPPLRFVATEWALTSLVDVTSPEDLEAAVLGNMTTAQKQDIYGDEMQGPKNMGPLKLNFTASHMGGIQKDFNEMAGSVAPVRNFTYPDHNVTVGEHPDENNVTVFDYGPTIPGVLLFMTQLDPTVRYQLSIASHEGVCVFEKLDLVQGTETDAKSITDSATKSKGASLSTGAITGIAVGSAVGGLALLALLGFCCWRRRRSASRAKKGNGEYEFEDVSSHEHKPFAEMGAPTSTLVQGERPPLHSQTASQMSGMTLSPEGTMNGSLSTREPMSATTVRHEEDAGALDAELPATEGGGEVVLPPVYRDEWAGTTRPHSGRGLNINTNLRSPHEMTPEEIKYLGPPTPGATLTASPLTTGDPTARSFGSWMSQSMSTGAGAQLSPIGSQPLSPLTSSPRGGPHYPGSKPLSQPVSPTETDSQMLSPVPSSAALGAQQTGSSITEAHDNSVPLITPFPPDLRPRETGPHGFPRDRKR